MPDGMSEDLGRFAPLQQAGQAMRRKTWDELGLEEKIERIREVLRMKEFAIGELREQLGALLSHQHGTNGELLQPVRYGMGGQGVGRGYDPLA